LQNLSYLQNENAGYIDELFNSYSQDPSSVDPSWRYFFEGLELGIDTESRAPQTSQPGSPVQPQTTERVTAAEKEDWKKWQNSFSPTENLDDFLRILTLLCRLLPLTPYLRCLVSGSAAQI